MKNARTRGFPITNICLEFDFRTGHSNQTSPYSRTLRPKQVGGLKRDFNEHSVEEVLERLTGYPKGGGSNHGSGDFSLQPQRNPYLS